MMTNRPADGCTHLQVLISTINVNDNLLSVLNNMSQHTSSHTYTTENITSFH